MLYINSFIIIIISIIFIKIILYTKYQISKSKHKNEYKAIFNYEY